MSSHPLTLTPGPPLTPSSREYVQYRIRSNSLTCERNTCPLIPSLSHLAPLSLHPPENMYNIEYNPILRPVNETHILSSPHPHTWHPLSAPPYWDYILFTVEHNPFCRRVNEPHFIPISHSNLCRKRWKQFRLTGEKAWHSVTITKFFKNFSLRCSVSPPVKNKFYFPGYSIHIPGWQYLRIHYRFILYFHTYDVYIRHSTYTFVCWPLLWTVCM